MFLLLLAQCTRPTIITSTATWTNYIEITTSLLGVFLHILSVLYHILGVLPYVWRLPLLNLLHFIQCLPICHHIIRVKHWKPELLWHRFLLLAKVPRVLKQPHPGTCISPALAQPRWVPRLLPHEAATLGVRHHGKMAPVFRAERSDAISRSIWVGGVCVGYFTFRVAVPDGARQLLCSDFLQSSVPPPRVVQSYCLSALCKNF